MLRTAARRHVCQQPHAALLRRRALVTLAIETSCDDTCVAVLEKTGNKVQIHHHEKLTSNNLAHRGIHPLVALQSHHANLAPALDRALTHLPSARPPDLVAVTRGPGMRANLHAGLNTAKGLAVAWRVPLLAVHHMQAHALTPRLVAASHASATPNSPPDPAFPFLSLLVSGGHTQLLHSRTLTDHATLAATLDIAVGEAVDKIARALLPPHALAHAPSTSYGPALEAFAFPPGSAASDFAASYAVPASRTAELARHDSPAGWSLNPPLAKTAGGMRARAMHFSFSGTCAAVQRIAEGHGPAFAEEARRELAAVALRLLFEHLAVRLLWALDDAHAAATTAAPPSAVVVSGGVAANAFLRYILRAWLDARGYAHIKLVLPPPELCTDNAVMIGWAALEMWEAGYASALSVDALRKWAMDPAAEDGGILGVGGWTMTGRGAES